MESAPLSSSSSRNRQVKANKKKKVVDLFLSYHVSPVATADGLPLGPTTPSSMVLSQQEIEKAHDAFEKFDVDHSGCIDAWELKEAMKSLGQNPTDEEVFGLLAQVDTDGSGNIDFQEFLQVIEKQRDSQGDTGEDWDMVSAFVALGGNADKSGEIDIDKLRDMINKFELTIDIEGLIEETDKDGSGLIDYGEFKAMLS